MGDGPTSDMDAACGFIKAYENQIVSVGCQGICIATGHDSEFFNNRVELLRHRIDSGMATLTEKPMVPKCATISTCPTRRRRIVMI